MSARILNYKKKEVCIGIDVHKKTYVFSAFFEEEIVKTATVPANAKQFVDCLKKWFPNARFRSVYEAGFSGYNLHRQLETAGIKNIVINPASLEVPAKDKVKTDKKDSKKMAVQLATGRLKGIYIPTKEEELDRLLTRNRQQIIQQRTRVANRIKSLLLYFDLLKSSDNRIMSDKFLRECESMDLPIQLKASLGLFIAEWRFLTNQLKSLVLDMKEQSFKDSYKEAIYQSVPGVGDISARVLSNELGDLSKRFKNERSLFQFIGLTPCEHSSGEKQRLGNIDRQGSARIRKTLVECSWKAINVDSGLSEVFLRIAHRRGKRRAIVAIARKLAGRMRACFINQEEYCLGL